MYDNVVEYCDDDITGVKLTNTEVYNFNVFLL